MEMHGNAAKVPFLESLQRTRPNQFNIFNSPPPHAPSPVVPLVLRVASTFLLPCLGAKAGKCNVSQHGHLDGKE